MWRIAGRIDDDACGAAAALLHPGNQFALAIGLPEVDGEPKLLGGLGTQRLDIIERGAARKMRLSRPSMFMFGPFSTTISGRETGTRGPRSTLGPAHQ